MKDYTAEIYKGNWEKMNIPKEITYKEVNGGYAKFIMEPLYKGFGVTIGHSLRRVLLSSLVGCAITAVKIEEVEHEYETVSGMREDILQVLLNLKELVISPLVANETYEMELTAQGPCIVTASNISCKGKVEIQNSEHVICTLNENAKIEMKLFASMNRGFVSAEDNHSDNAPVNTIFLDSSHSPVQRVNYSVENTRLGDRTDYDRLIFELWTNGSILASDAIAYSAKILKEYNKALINFDEGEDSEENEAKAVDLQMTSENQNLKKIIKDLELSVRAINCLQNAKIETVAQLVLKTEEEMLATKNFGRKSLQEIKALLAGMGLTLGMRDEYETSDDKDSNTPEVS